MEDDGGGEKNEAKGEDREIMRPKNKEMKGER